MIAMLWFMGLPVVAISTSLTPTVGLATVYNPTDKHGGGDRIGCPGAMRKRFGRKLKCDPVTRSCSLLSARKLARREGAWLVAMRPEDVACGTEVTVCSGDWCGRGIVGDTGPWGANCPSGYKRPVNLPPECERVGLIDLDPEMGRKLLPGKGWVRKGTVAVWGLRSTEASKRRYNQSVGGHP